MGYIFTKPLHFIILSFLLCQLSRAQVNVSGNISSAQGDPLPGATVSLTGKPLTTFSDEKGNYSIEAQEGDALEFSMSGFESVVRKVSDSNVINVKLPAQKTQELQEVVVNAAYRRIKAQEFTGASNEVKKETITRNSASSAQAALENAPGVIVNQSSGQAGSGFNVRVRGVASLNGSQDPLYVIDGVPIASGDFSGNSAISSNTTSLINPEDIESMTVLQDAAATSLYGSRAANGVVVITTKKGKRGQTKFSLKAESGFSDKAYDSYKKIDGEEFRKLRKEGLKNQYLNARGETPEEAERKASEDLEKLYPVPPGGYVNWQDLLFRTGSLQNYQFTATGGTDKTRVLANLGFYKEKSIVYDSDFKRASMRVNIDHKATKNFSFGANTSFSFADRNGVSDQRAYYANPWMMVNRILNPTSPLYQDNGNYTELINNQYTNLVRERGMNVNNQKQYRLLLNPWAEFKWRDISFKSNNQLDFLNSLSQIYYPSNSSDGRAYEGLGQKLANQFYTLTSSNTINYDKQLSENHHINALLGFEAMAHKRDYTGIRVGKFSDERIKVPSGGAQYLWHRGDFREERLLSVFSALDYNYDRRYYLSASVRRDGSSRLHPKSRWANFWALSGAWMLSKEDFFKNDAIDLLKIKLSYGTTGNYPNSFYGGRDYYKFNEKYNDQSAAYPFQLAREDLSWEKIANFNAGIEFGILRKLTGKLEFYRKYTTSLLQEVPIPSTTGFKEQLQNAGEMSNTGWELSLSYQVIKNHNFSWSSTLSAFSNRNKIEKLYNGEQIIEFPRVLREGHSFYSFYLPRAAGVDPQTGRMRWYKNSRSGELTENYNQAERTIVGKFEPDLIGSFGSDFKYKDFEFGFNFRFQFGGKIYDELSQYLINDGSDPNTPVSEKALDRWKKPGDRAKNPIFENGHGYQSSSASDRYLYSATYVRLKNLYIAYNLPSEPLKKHLGIEKCKIYFNATNLWTWAKNGLFDPENVVTNVDYIGQTSYAIPATKTFMLGLQLDF